MLASEIITRAREGLSDVQKTRWSDTRLLALLFDGLQILSLETTLFMEDKYIELVQDLEHYDLSDRAMRFIRIEHLDRPLVIGTHEALDKIDRNWRNTTASHFKFALTDKSRPGVFTLYPKVPDLTLSLVNNVNGPYGIITDISYTDYQLASLPGEGEIGSPENKDWLRVYYTLKFDQPELDTDLDIEPFIRVGLEHYIVGRALRANQDTQNRTIGNEEYALWNELVEKYKIEKSKLYATANLTVPYRGGIQ